MKMLAISGQQADSFHFKQFPEFPHHLVQVFVWMLQNGFVHMDLHQGNILMVSRSDLEDFMAIARCSLELGMQDGQESLSCIFGRLGIRRKDGQALDEDICKLAVQDLSILNVMMDSEHKKELALRIAPLDFVGCSWWQCLMKANGALANSLSGCGCHRDDTQRLFAKYLV